jgi:hypothetical protein
MAEPTDPSNPGGNDAASKTVAQDVFNRVVEAKTGLEAQVRTLQAENQKLVEKAATVDNLTSQVTDWKGKFEQASTRFATFTELSGALGTTDTDVIDQFDVKYRALPEAARPERKAWVESLKAKPDEAPAVLRPWLAPVVATATPTKPAPKVPGTQPTPPGTVTPTSASEVRAMREKAVATGDWTDWKAWKKSQGL